MKIHGLLSLIVLLGLFGNAMSASVPEAPVDGQPQELAPAPVPTPGPPGTLEIATQAGAITASAAQTEKMIQGLESVEELTPEIHDVGRRHGELLALTTSMTGADFVRLERLSRLQDQSILEEGRLKEIHERLTARLAKLRDAHEMWTEHRQLWRSRLDALDTDPDLAAARPGVTASLLRIEQVLEQATAAASLPLALQVEVESLRAKFAQLNTTVTAIQARRRQALFERTSPVLFSAEHRTQLREGGWRAWDPTAGIDHGAYFVFARDNLGLLGFLLFLALLIGGMARAGRLVAARKGIDGWAGILAHPFALGVFVSVMVAMTQIILAPPLWDVLLWALFGVTAAIIGYRFVKIRALRRTIYLLAVFYPGFLLLEVAQFPGPVFRVGLTVVAAGAIPLFLHLARPRTQVAYSGPGSKQATVRATWPLRLGAGVWMWVFFALVVGYDTLARWTLHATAMTAALAFTAALGFALTRATAETLSQLKDSGPIPRRAGVLLARRVVSILRVVIYVVIILVLLDTWGITDSPVATWQAVTDAGFKVGTLQVTVGRILLGAGVVYLAVIVSGFGRALAAYRFGPKSPTDGSASQVLTDQGLGESIAKLAQYVFITLGFILALAVIGVELKNFALIAGALGIGVGFGLQNVVNNFASGLILLFERPVRVGDTVVVGDVFGTVQKIGFLATVMLTLDQSEMIVPNGDLVSEKIINWTLTSPIARMFVPVSVAYGSPVAEVLDVLSKAAFAHEGVLKDPAPQALFMGFGESALDFELRVWVQDIRMRMEMRSTVLTDIDRRLREAGIEIPFPQRDLHLRSIDPDVLKQLTARS